MFDVFGDPELTWPSAGGCGNQESEGGGFVSRCLSMVPIRVEIRNPIRQKHKETFQPQQNLMLLLRRGQLKISVEFICSSVDSFIHSFIHSFIQ